MIIVVIEVRYSLDKIKELRLEGKSLKEIADYYNVHKSTISKWLKNKGKPFNQLSIRCRYCGKIFKPKNNEKFCSDKCRKYSNEERISHYFKKKHRKEIHLNRDNPNIYYHDNIERMNSLKSVAEKCGCECGNKEFIVENNSVFCTKCGLEFINSTDC